MKCPLKLTRSEVPHDIEIGNNASLVGIEDPDKTVTVPNSCGVIVLSDEKWTVVRRKRSEKKLKVVRT